MKGIAQHFNEMEDVRQKHKIKHLTGEILTIALCAVALGVETVYEIGEFAKIKEYFKCDEIKDKISAENMIILRQIALNRMKMFDNSRLKSKKMKYAFDDDFRYKILFKKLRA